MRRIFGLPIVIAAAALAGCTETANYAFVPTQNATAAIAGRAAADYQLPPGAPTGDVRLASFGIAELTPQNDDSTEVHAVHLRFVVSNNGTVPWTFDTREQRLDLKGRGMAAPAFASSDRGAKPPVVAVAPNASHAVDVFFPLPPDLADSDELPAFDVLWRVHAGPQVVVVRTPFERIEAEPPPDYVYEGVYWGGPYWYDPYWVGWGWRLPPVYVGHPFVVHRWHGGWGWHGGGYYHGAPHFHGGGGFHGGFHGGGHHR